MKKFICKLCLKERLIHHGRQKYCSVCKLRMHRKQKKKSDRKYVKIRSSAGGIITKEKRTPEQEKRHEKYLKRLKEGKREKYREYSRQYYKKHKEKWKKYRKSSFREKVINAFKKMGLPIECQSCGFDNEDILIPHHKIPLSKGGTNEIENLYLLCPNCHSMIETPKYRDKIEEQIQSRKKTLIKVS